MAAIKEVPTPPLMAWASTGRLGWNGLVKMKENFSFPTRYGNAYQSFSINLKLR
ncbi:MAG: hypothetical protein AOA65_0623 [Candidatus Bathyarchaeota archaeon BA1]|nr:MAG: hypothetical protein AOA65_0623 [Candidatus Bathyarchaeota archaeon BA1]